MEEKQAIDLLKLGDLQGFETLIQLYYFQAVKTAYLIVQDREEAEDIVQTAFLHASEKIDQLVSDRFGPWFLRSVVNASIKVARKQKRQVSLDTEGVGEAQTLEEILDDRQPSPETQVEMGELSQAVWQALRQ
jgi:RNA polymerase sigma-70 factor (ECF subfamily)